MPALMISWLLNEIPRSRLLLATSNRLVPSWGHYKLNQDFSSKLLKWQEAVLRTRWIWLRANSTSWTTWQRWTWSGTSKTLKEMWLLPRVKLELEIRHLDPIMRGAHHRYQEALWTKTISALSLSKKETSIQGISVLNRKNLKMAVKQDLWAKMTSSFNTITTIVRAVSTNRNIDQYGQDKVQTHKSLRK